MVIFIKHVLAKYEIDGTARFHLFSESIADITQVHIFGYPTFICVVSWIKHFDSRKAVTVYDQAKVEVGDTERRRKVKLVYTLTARMKSKD